MESHLADVIDPAGGSWYVEQLTADLAQACVGRVPGRRAGRRIPRRGRGGRRQRAHRRRASEARDRHQPAHARRSPGSREFPNIAEPVPAVVRASHAAGGRRSRDAGSERSAMGRASREPALAGRCGRRGGHAPGGVPRHRSDRRPRSRRRAMFAKNFFEVAGIETRTGHGHERPCRDRRRIRGRRGDRCLHLLERRRLRRDRGGRRRGTRRRRRRSRLPRRQAQGPHRLAHRRRRHPHDQRRHRRVRRHCPTSSSSSASRREHAPLLRRAAARRRRRAAGAPRRLAQGRR